MVERMVTSARRDAIFFANLISVKDDILAEDVSRG